METLIKMLKRHEGYRNRVYMDSTGNLTCGWGHCLLEGSRVPEDASEAFFRSDVAEAVTDFWSLPLSREVRGTISYCRRLVLVDMLFNMGLSKVAKFKKMLAAIEIGDWDKAADEMLDSLWAKQVGDRAVELAEIMRTGEKKEG